MYSYPNMIPLPASEVQRIKKAIEPWRFERLYGGWFDAIVTHNAHASVMLSAERYIHASGGIAQ